MLIRVLINSLTLLALISGQNACAQVTSSPNGKLMIVGGGLRASNQEIYQSFIAHAKEGKFGIIPAASGKPSQAAKTFADTLARYGVDRDRIQIIPIAIRDDSTTNDIDESKWNKNAWESELAEQVASCSAIWFTGGDQSRIMQALTDKAGSASPALTAVRTIYQDGGIIGGTSAGAAIQSETMILGGTSQQAFDHGTLTEYPGMESQENGPLVLGDGLGFFPHGIIDQHFDRKARLGRLIVALLDNPSKQKVGYGIDEDTALLFDASNQTGLVLGSGTVVKIDTQNAARSEEELGNVRISVLGPGDRIAFTNDAISINSGKKKIGSEYLELQQTHVSSLFSPYSGRLEEVLGFLLLDNSSTKELETRIPMETGGERTITFQQDEDTSGYWGYLDGQLDSYSVLNVALSISPPPNVEKK
ncbi:cyanophycinase [Pelagicoccus mobilis]|uniref:Cyanophycinase n=1 Tax=Pelagicoccus mobilis TaxID=415221 RepID=A0A934VPX4_9BACT|nr:cyanophycinase [Pelagicoccus mobilis]MBK1875978.1 cyanophycinase [Pelagicoccus mobilis]